MFRVNQSVTPSHPRPSMPTSRSYTLVLVLTAPPTTVTVNGVALTYSRWGGGNAWTFDGTMGDVIIQLPYLPVSTPINVVVSGQSSLAVSAVPGTPTVGLRGGLRHALLAKSNLDEERTTPGSTSTDGAFI
jgi:hypothetical protein